MDCSLPGFCPWDSPGKNTGVGCHFFLQNVASSSPLKRIQRRCARLCQALPSLAVGPQPAQPPGTGFVSQVREADERAGTPFLSLLADASFQNSWFSVLWLLSVYSFLIQYYIYEVALFFLGGGWGWRGTFTIEVQGKYWASGPCGISILDTLL